MGNLVIVHSVGDVEDTRLTIRPQVDVVDIDFLKWSE